MNYKDINDYELIFMVKEQDEEAENILYKKYYYLIRTIIKKYKRVSYILGIDIKDLMQESLIAFSCAIKEYKDDYDTNFSSFLYLCINRRLSNYIRQYNTIKNKTMNNAISIDDDNINSYLCDNSDPLYLLCNKENKEIINKVLNKNELYILSLYIDGYKYNEIASTINKSYKYVDGMIQKIKNKLKKVIDV